MNKYILLVLLSFLQYQPNQCTIVEHKGLLWSSLHGLDYQFKAGVNIGGTSPLPPSRRNQKHRKLFSRTCYYSEGNVTKWIDVQKKWGVSLGVRLANKNMTTEALVKTMVWKYSTT